MIRVPTNRVPTHPGQMLLQEFLMPLKISQVKLSKELGIPFQRVNEIVNGKRGVTPSTALKLGKFFGNSPSFWLNLQMRSDLYLAKIKEENALKRISPFLEKV